VSLTKTKGKGRVHKEELVSELRDAVDQYQSLFVFSFENMRTAKFKDVRLEFRDSR
jgi:mRNA turnover protein 4